MRKFLILATLLVGFASIAVPLTGTTSAAICVEEGCVPPSKPKPSARSQSHAGPWIVGCGIVSAGSLMVGTAVHAGDKKDQRQLTINEAAWHSAACPLFLPWALLVQATCPDNKGTFQVARLAFKYVSKHPASDQSAFTAAYGEACRTGKLSRSTRKALQSLI